MKLNKRILSLILAVVMVLGMVPMATAADDAAATCTECGSVGGHTLGCSQFVIPTCEECHGDLLGEKAGHSTACSQYVAPETTPAPASEEGTEGTTEGTTVATTVATTEGATEGTTVATTEATTAPSTEVTTEPSTEATTEAATEPSTEATEPSTEATEPSTEVTEPPVLKKFSLKAPRAASTNQPRLLRDAIAAVPEYSARYSIETFKVNLFDYTPTVFNGALGSGNHFKFVGYDTGVASNGGVNDSTSTYAKQGIVQDTLKNGLPVFNNVTSGEQNAKQFFDPGTLVDGKTSYPNVDFEVIYDAQTGYYEYKSSANHAQYNAGANSIELYADTLSTQNAWTKMIDLSQAEEGNGLTNFNKSGNLITGQTSKNTDGRMDPYFYVSNVNISGSKINEIYMDVKVPAAAGKLQAKVYYTIDGSKSFKEDQSFKVAFTANGDWQTVKIIPSDDEIWDNAKITNLRIDPMDNYDTGKSTDSPTWVDTTVNGNKGGNYNIEVKNVILYGGSTYSASVGYATNGGFYPFSDIRNSYESKQPFTMSNWAAHMALSSDAEDFASRSMGNPSLASNDLTNELAYGMAMEFDFYLPVATPANDLTFYFSGDDDLWVFCDNQLVLDIGGGHGAINGSVNFTKGKSVVQNAVQVTGFDSNAGSAGKRETNLSESLYSPGKHTLKVFYLERCGSVSNCQIKFNLPQTPQGSVVVSKTVEEINDADLSVLKNEEFDFTISAKYMGAGDSAFTLPAAFSHIAVADDGRETVTEKQTDAQGNFKLKHGEKAVFNIDENYDVTIKELDKAVPNGYSYKGTTLNGVDGKQLTQWTVDSQVSYFNYVNKYDEIEVTFQYIPVNPEGCPDRIKGTVEFTGEPATKTKDTTGLSETIGCGVGEPKGSTAADNTSVKFVGWFLNPECTQAVTAQATVTDKVLDPNHPVKDASGPYVGGTFYAKFEYKLGDLVISKKGIDALDHHEDTEPGDATDEEVQSTIYCVQGTSYAGEAVNLEVTFPGNGSVTIKNIPAGEYTVTEKVDWSWRYEAKKTEKKVTIQGDDEVKAAFENTRIKLLWLSGDNYTRNSWASGTLTRNDYTWQTTSNNTNN